MKQEKTNSPLIAIVFPSRMATRVTGTAGLEETAVPDFVSVDDVDDVAIAAIVTKSV